MGRTASVTDESGAVTTFGYDARDRRTSVTDPLARTTAFTHDDAGRQLLVTSPAGRTMSTAYDAAGQVLSSTQAAGTADAATTTMTYDADGRTLTQTDAVGSTVTFTYDSRGQQISAADALGNVQSTAYNARGLATTTTNPDGTTTLAGYDAAGQLVSQRDERGFTRTYAYTGRGQLATLTDARGSVTGWTYDAAGRLTRKTYTDATQVNYAYDAAGRLATRTWARGVVTTYAYDVRDRVTGVTYSDGTPAVAMTYDVEGRVTGIGNAAATSTYAYDAAGQITLETQSIAGHPLGVRSLTPSHDADGLRTALTYPSGKALGASYTARSQLAGVTFNGQAIATHTWRANGQALGTSYGNGAQRTMAFDAANRLTGTGTSLGGTTLTGRGYTLDTMGRRTAYTDETSASATFGYDLSGQVLAGTVPVPKAAASASTYAYDAEGNRTAASLGGAPVTYTTNALNQYTAIQQSPANDTPTYDADGNTLSTLNSQRSSVLTWDGENRMTGNAPAAPAIGDRAIVCAYDATGRRVRKSVSQWNGSAYAPVEDRYFAYDGWNQIEETITPSGGTTTTAECLWGADVSGSTQGAGGVGGLLARLSTVNAQLSTAFYHYDANGNVAALTDPAGIVQAAYSYGPFGELLQATGPQAAANPWRFSTKYQDDETGLLYYGYRYYDPVKGRWLSRDPIGERGGINLFLFCNNNSTYFIDPFGLVMLAIPPSWAPFLRGAVEFAVESPKYWTGPRLQPPVPAPIIPSPSQPTPSNPSPNGSNTAPVEPQPFPIPEIKPQNPKNPPYISDPQAGKDHEDYKNACGKKLPGEFSGDPCTRLRAMLERYRKCAELREAWDNKWNPGRHAADIWDAKRAYNKALEQINKQCPPKNCPPQNGGGEPPLRDKNGNLIA